jgi:DNA-binding response OmpR family regulator
MQKILVLDDQADIRDIVETYLGLQHFDVMTASSKNEFFEKLVSFEPGLVILDVMLGVDDGRAICREIKSGPYGNIPVILFSANPALLSNFRECNADDVLEKPFDLKVLLNSVQRNLVPSL